MRFLVVKRLLFIMCLCSNLFGYIIDFSGKFTLGFDLLETGTDAIIIQANNVVLDLDDHIVSSDNNGIVVKAGTSGVVVFNGFVAGTPGTAILIEENCRSILFQGVSVSQCAGPGIELLGTSTADTIFNAGFRNITLNALALSPATTNVINMQFCNNILFDGLILNGCGTSLNNLTLMNAHNSRVITCDSAIMTNNKGANLIGVDLSTTSSSIFRDVNLYSNEADGGILTGFCLTTSSQENVFSLCNIFSSSVTDGDAVGFLIEDASAKNIFSECRVSGMVANNVTGFRLTGNTDPSDVVQNLFNQCAALDNFALTGTVIGYDINNADDGSIIESFAADNRAPQGLAAGLRFTMSGGGTRWNINGNRFTRNIGLSDADSFGVLLLTGTENLFIQNVAFANGDTPGNQLFGVYSGSVTEVDVTNLNSVMAPWTNMAITP